MRHRLQALALMVGSLIGGPAAAEIDLAKALVGTWEGEVERMGVTGDPSRDAQRTLVIQAVTSQADKWVGEGRFGITGRRLAPVQIEVDASGNTPSIRFVNGPMTIRLQLLDDKHLAGTFTPPAAGRRGSEPLPLRMEKKD
jgi:hypothetical protein